LKDAELIAYELRHKLSDNANLDQLAKSLGAPPTSGAFRIKVATARTFGAIAVTHGDLSLTYLGRRLIDPETQAQARVEAFMTVPLFAALAEEYGDASLPSDPALERKIHDLGVSTKLVRRARQAFLRSAELAGFFRHGRDRLVPPETILGQGDERSTVDRETKEGRQARTGTSAVPIPLTDLWLTLLDEGASWSPEKTGEFLDAARRLRRLLATDG
jgi:hypothetical protein